jgi:predicted ester cyclase
MSSTARQRLDTLRIAMCDFGETTVRRAFDQVFSDNVTLHLCHPLGTMHGTDELYAKAYAPLLHAWPDLERRDWIVIEGQTESGETWIGCGGHYIGTFSKPWIDIPPTGHVVSMRFHEFYRVQDSRVVEMQSIWDIPEVMMQAGAWPAAPSLGRDWMVPSPATQDGLGQHDHATTAASLKTVLDMLTAMTRHPREGGPEVMELDRFWHPRFMWYGPAGIGTARGTSGFRNWHQIPFLAAMPDRGQHPEGLQSAFFAEGPYVAVTGWPNMRQTLTGGGWLGLPPTNTRIDLRSLDFWRLENGLIRENWVLVDLLHVQQQLGHDLLARMREFNKARQGFDSETGRALP